MDNLGFTVTMDIYTVNLRDIRFLKDLLNARTPFDSCTVELSCKQKTYRILYSIWIS